MKMGNISSGRNSEQIVHELTSSYFNPVAESEAISNRMTLEDIEVTGSASSNVEENFDESFYSKIIERMKTAKLSYSCAMDQVRLDRLVEHCGSAEKTLLFLFIEWGYEPQIYRFTKILLARGTRCDTVKTTNGDSLLHIAALKNYGHVAQLMIENCAILLSCLNLQEKTAVELAIEGNCDASAAAIIKGSGNSIQIIERFTSRLNKESQYSFVQLIEKGVMKETIIAILDRLVVPCWPHPPSKPISVFSGYSTEDMPDVPTHYEVNYRLLECDRCGREPGSQDFQYTSNGCLYHIANNQELNTILVEHPAVKSLLNRKWKKYGRFWFRFRFLNYLVFIAMLASKLLIYSREDQTNINVGDFTSPLSLPDVWCMLMEFWFLIDEISEMGRDPLNYFKDFFNLFDVLAILTFFAIIPLRFYQHNWQWYMAALTFLFNVLRIFKYSVVISFTGAYTKALGLVVWYDIPRFLLVFCIVLWAFAGSSALASRASFPEFKEFGEILKTDILGKFNQTTSLDQDGDPCGLFSGTFCLLVSGMRHWLSGKSTLDQALQIQTGFPVIMSICFMIAVSIVLANILIAQLSNTYDRIQGETQVLCNIGTLTAITTAEWQSRFKFWNCRVKYYVAKEMKKTEDIKEMHASFQKQLKGATSIEDLEARLDKIENNLLKS